MRRFTGFTGMIFLALVGACQGSEGTGTVVRPSASQMPLPPGPTPTVLTPGPTPTPTSAAVAGLERYVHQFYCEPVAKTLADSRLDYINDLAVSPDGQTVYFVYHRTRSSDGQRRTAPAPTLLTPEQILARQLIYRLDVGGQVSPLQIQGEYPQSCFLAPEIEKNSQGELIVTRPMLSDDGWRMPVTGHVFYRINPDRDSIEEIASIKLGEPNPSASDRPDARELSRLHLKAKDNTLYYGLEAPQYEGQTSVIHHLNGKTSEQLLVVNNGGAVPPFSFDPEDGLIIGTQLAPSPYPANIQSLPSGQPLIQAEGLTVTDLRLDVAHKRLYISDNQSSHSIWTLDLTNKQLSRIAGSGQAGFSDGQGQTAQFNRPGAMDVDVAGNLYVADVGNQAIRKLSPEGLVTTLYRR